MKRLPQTTPAECLKQAQISLDDVTRNINPETDSQALHDVAAAVSWILEYLKAQQAGKAGQGGGV